MLIYICLKKVWLEFEHCIFVCSKVLQLHILHNVRTCWPKESQNEFQWCCFDEFFDWDIENIINSFRSVNFDFIVMLHLMYVLGKNNHSFFIFRVLGGIVLILFFVALSTCIKHRRNLYATVSTIFFFQKKKLQIGIGKFLVCNHHKKLRP